MALGPRLDLRQSQSLVMTPQLQQAIRLLALSNLEVESFIAEEIERNPLLESAGGEAAETERADAPEADEPGFEGEDGPEAPEVDQLVRTGDATSDAPLDVDYNDENLHQDSAADRGLDGGARHGGNRGWRRLRRGRAGFRPLRRRRRLAPRASARPGRRAPVRRRFCHRDADHRADRRDRLFHRRAARSGQPARRATLRGRAGARHRPDVRPCRHRRPLARRVPRAPGEGGGPLRSRHGAADRQSRLSRARQSRRAEADLRRRRRGSRRHDPRAARLRPEARLPLRAGRAGRGGGAGCLRRQASPGLGYRAQRCHPAAPARQPLLIMPSSRTARRTESQRPGSPNASPAPTG